MKDTFKHKGKRKKLVKEIESKGIKDKKVLEAFMEVPRHFFLESAFEQHAYEDKPFSIGSGQTISQPFTVAYQTQALELKGGEKVLEIGTGSAYQASILAEMRCEVYSIERVEDLHKRARKLIERLDYNDRIQLKLGDGSKGWEEESPFDRIIVTAGAPVVSDKLKNQLSRDGGIMIIPVGDKNMQRMLQIKRLSENKFEEKKLDHFKFVPLIGEEGW